MEKEYREVASKIIDNSLGISSSEEILVVVNDSTAVYGKAFFEELVARGLKSVIMTMPLTRTDGAEPPETVGAAMARADLVIALTKYTLTHGAATKAALVGGTRVLSIPNLNDEIYFSPAMQLAPEAVSETVRLTEILSAGKRARLVTDAGTDISMDLGGWSRVGGADTGMIDIPGLLGNLPAGESLISPITGSAEGVVVVDASISGDIGLLEEPVVLTVSAGQVVDIAGGRQAMALKDILEKSDGNAFNLAELAFGINPKTRVIGNIIFDEKTRGTAHFGIGNSTMLGGDVYSNVHVDAVFKNPRLYVDEVLVVDGAEFYLDRYAPSYRDYPVPSLEGVRIIPHGKAIVEEGCLKITWKDVMGRERRSFVGDPQTSQLAAGLWPALKEDGRSLARAASEAGVDETESARVIGFLSDCGIVTLV